MTAIRGGDHRSGEPLRSRRLLAVLGISLGAAALLTVFLNDPIHLLNPLGLERPSTPLLLGALALWFFVSQLVPAPTGTLSIVASAALIGVSAGILYYVCTCLAAIVVHAVSAQHPAWANRALGRLPKRRRAAALARKFHSKARARPVLMMSLLRLAPLIPSAGVAILGGLSGIRLRAALIGTILAGWVRPSIIAVFATYGLSLI